MQSEVCSLFNSVSTYKERLTNVLNRIDDCLLNSSITRSEHVSISKKYKICNMMIKIIQNYLKMLYMGEEVLEKLLLEQSAMERDTEPERDMHTWNPFCSAPSFSSSLFDPNIFNEIEKNQSLDYYTASSVSDIVSTIDRRFATPYAVDTEVQTDTFESVDADVQTVDELETQILNCSSEKEKPKEEVDVYDVNVIIDELERKTQKLQNEGEDSGTCDIKQAIEDDLTDTKLEETLLNLPKVPPRKYLKQEVKNVAPISFKILPKREKLGVSPLCQSPELVESKKILNLSPDWRNETLKLFQNKKARSNSKLAPSSLVNSSSQSLKNIKKAKEKTAVYDILEEEVYVNEICTFSHIHTPSEFYVHIKGPTLCKVLENTLNDDINDQFQYVVNRYKTKEEAKTQLGSFCCGFIPSKRKWFRVEVLDWMFADTERIFVQMIDHGEKTYCAYTHLKPLNEFYAKIPRLAVRCHLAAVYSTDPIDRTKWSKESIDCLTELAEMKKTRKFNIFYLNREGNSYAVDLMKEPSTNEKSVGETLVSRELAFQIDIAQDDSLEKISEEDEDLENIENINEAVAGYDARDEARLCPFTDETGTKCFKGPSCKLEHGRLAKDGYTTDQVVTAQKTMVDFVLPATNEYILILITGRINTCHFYAHILTKRSSSFPYHNEEYIKLKDAMNTNNIVQTYEKFKVFPAPSELVLVKEGSEWLRGKCIAIEQDTIRIFLIDFGTIVFKSMKDLRQMKDDFLYVPQQAIECMLHHSQEKPDLSLEQSRQFFQTFMHMRLFTALVVDSSLPLRLRLWDEKQVDLDYVVRSYAIGQQRCDVHPAEESRISCP